MCWDEAGQGHQSVRRKHAKHWDTVYDLYTYIYTSYIHPIEPMPISRRSTVRYVDGIFQYNQLQGDN